MQQKLHAQPRNIGIFQLMGYRFPITAISSILHRITGVILFIAMPFMLYCLSESLNADTFNTLCLNLTHGYKSVLIWVVLSSLTFHLLAGIRHLFMDMGFFENMCSAKLGAFLVLLLGILGAIFWGVWL